MGFKEIVIHLDADMSDGAGRRRDFGLSLARTFDAHLTGIVFAIEPGIPPMIMGEVPGTLIESQRKEGIDAATAAAEGFTAAAAAAGLAGDVLTIEAGEGLAPDIFARQARVADLAVVGQSAPDDSLPLRDLILEAALFDSGRPVLIVPHIGFETVRLRHVVVAWDGHREAARAAHDALPLLRRAESVEIVAVDDGRMKPVKGEPELDLAASLARHGLAVTSRHIEAPDAGVATVLLRHAAGVSADLLVMGGYGHSRIREFIMGGATRGVLDAMTVPVLMAH